MMAKERRQTFKERRRARYNSELAAFRADDPEMLEQSRPVLPSVRRPLPALVCVPLPFHCLSSALSLPFLGLFTAFP